MYHSVSGDQEAGLHPYYRQATSPARFAQQMQWLVELGCVGMSLEQAWRTPFDGGTDGHRPVAITFDDGYRDFLTAAWPVLQRHRFTATMYLPTGLMDAPRQSLHGKECLTWSEVRELRAQGVRFGSHTVRHPKLYELPWSAIEREVAASKQRLELELGEAVSGFAYPYAFPQEDRAFTKTFSELLCRCGYQTCVTTVIGQVRVGDDPLRLKRLPANSCDDRSLVVAKLHGAYDWMGAAQRLLRQLKSWNNGARRCHSTTPARSDALAAHSVNSLP